MKKLEPFYKGTIALDVYEHQDLDEEYSMLPTSKLIEMLDTASHVGEETDDFDWTEYKRIAPIIAHRLGTPYQDYLLEDLAAQLNERIEVLNELIENFTNHRHCLDKTYGEKPIW